MSNHLIPKIDDRGLKHMPKISCDDAGGTRIGVYESSLATEPSLWIRITDSRGHEAYAPLALSKAVQLAEQIMWLSEHHYQVEGVSTNE
jgi:hypothetical protein